MEQASADRKSRLAQLKAKKLAAESGQKSVEAGATTEGNNQQKPSGKRGREDDTGGADTEGSKAKLTFRSYNPEESDSTVLPKYEVKKVDVNQIEEKLENEVQQVIEEVKKEEMEKRAEDMDLFNLAPKKPNWDLKRDIEKKLKRLDRKTQNAVAELIRQRIQSSDADSAVILDATRNIEFNKNGSEPTKNGNGNEEEGDWDED
ncbi:cwf18 pre-mRNA splicing factor-domain-containing protein [Paraphysoderma sedebokerense]|nr:cwf18 pre-mRNA splicing factor-domain-containing protein [Paraphysoderma sedebokerense]